MVPTAPTAVGALVFVAGSDGIVRALDAASGQVKWESFTGGAVRLPPTIADGRALVGSGDGWVYAWEVATGRQLWQFDPEVRQNRPRPSNGVLQYSQCFIPRPLPSANSPGAT